MDRMLLAHTRAEPTLYRQPTLTTIAHKPHSRQAFGPMGATTAPMTARTWGLRATSSFPPLRALEACRPHVLVSPHQLWACAKKMRMQSRGEKGKWCQV